MTATVTASRWVGPARLVLSLLAAIGGGVLAFAFVTGTAPRNPYPEIVVAAVGAMVLTWQLSRRALKQTLPAPVVTVPIIALISFFSAFTSVGVCLDAWIRLQAWWLG